MEAFRSNHGPRYTFDFMFLTPFVQISAVLRYLEANLLKALNNIYFRKTPLSSKYFKLTSYELCSLENHIWLQNMLFCFFYPFLTNFWLSFGRHWKPVRSNHGLRYTYAWFVYKENGLYYQNIIFGNLEIRYGVKIGDFAFLIPFCPNVGSFAVFGSQFILDFAQHIPLIDSNKWQIVYTIKL